MSLVNHWLPQLAVLIGFPSLEVFEQLEFLVLLDFLSYLLPLVRLLEFLDQGCLFLPLHYYLSN